MATLLSQFATGYPQKLATLALILLPVLFLALRSLLVLAAIPGLALRFLDTDSAYWGPHFHYNAPLMPIVFLAAVDALARARSQGRLGAALARSIYNPRPVNMSQWLARHHPGRRYKKIFYADQVYVFERA